jgi:hypothetical protein
MGTAEHYTTTFLPSVHEVIASRSADKVKSLRSSFAVMLTILTDNLPIDSTNLWDRTIRETTSPPSSHSEHS